MAGMLSINQGRLVSGNGKGKKLTPKMLDFVDHYMICMNATKAVELSSYQAKDCNQLAYELMQHPLIRLEIEKRLAARSEKAEIKAEYLILKLMKIIEATETDNPQAALRAIELAGKSIALWKERQEVSGPDGQAIRYEQDITESARDFSRKIAGLVKRNDESSRVPSVTERDGTNNIVSFPDGSGTS